MSVLDRFGLAGRVAGAIIAGAAIGSDRFIANTLAVWSRASRLDESRVRSVIRSACSFRNRNEQNHDAGSPAICVGAAST